MGARAFFAWLLFVLATLVAASAFAQTYSTTYTYDALGRLTHVSAAATGGTTSSTYSYDPANNRTQVAVSAPVTLSPTTLPSGTVGAGYSQTITAGGGTGTGYSFSFTGTLPAGLTLSSGGLLSGTPSTSGTSSFTVKATDSGGNTGTQAYNLTIGAGVTLSPTTLPNGTVGSGYSQTITASGGTGTGYSFSFTGTLPAGLTLSSGGLLSGTPTATGASSFTVKATDSGGNTGTQAYSLTIGAGVTLSPTTLPNGTVGSGYSQTITASGGTGTGYSYSVSTGALPAGLTLTSGGVLSGTPATSGTSSFTVKATDSGGNTGTQAYSITIYAPVTVAPASLPNGTVGITYSQTITASGGTSTGYSYSVSAGTLPAGLSLTSGGVLSGSPTATGTSSFTVRATDSGGNAGSQAYSITIYTPVTVNPGSLPNGSVGTSYSQSFSASGGTGTGYSYSVSSGAIPAGLTLSSTGALTGTPTTAAAYSFTIRAIDSGGNSGTRAYSVTIAVPCTGVQFNNASEPIVNEGSPMSFTITKSGTTSDTCTVAYRTQDDTAKAGVNYVATSGTLSFAASDTSKSVSVSTIDDHVVTTSSYYVDLLISSPSGASTIANATTFGEIKNIDVNSNQPPVANSDSYTLQCNTSHSENVTANDTDPEGDPLTITSVWSDGRTSISILNAQQGLITVNTNAQTGTFNGSYVISDGHGNAATGQLYLNVIHGGPGGC